MKSYNLKKKLHLIVLSLMVKRNRFYNFFNIINFFILFKYNFKLKRKIKKYNFVSSTQNKEALNKVFNLLILKIFFWFLKFKFWRKVNFFIIFFFTKFIKNYMILRICKINYLGININIIGAYIIKRLKQRFKVVELILPVIRNLKKNKTLLGFKFSFCGRFSRKEIATTEFFSYAAVPFNTINFFIDYTLVGVILKDSYCGIKIWLNRKRDKFLDLFFYSNNLIWKILI